MPEWCAENILLTTSEGYLLKVWSVYKASNKLDSIQNSPLQLVIPWMIYRDIIDDISMFIINRVNNCNEIDLDW